MEMGYPEKLEAIRRNIRQVIVGKDEVINKLLIALICSGHVLIEDMPGLGKTTLAAALAASLGCSFKRIQFTPDVLPSDTVSYTHLDVYKRQHIHRQQEPPAPVDHVRRHTAPCHLPGGQPRPPAQAQSRRQHLLSLIHI